MENQPLGEKIARPAETSNQKEMNSAMKAFEDKPEDAKKA